MTLDARATLRAQADAELEVEVEDFADRFAIMRDIALSFVQDADLELGDRAVGWLVAENWR